MYENGLTATNADAGTYLLILSLSKDAHSACAAFLTEAKRGETVFPGAGKKAGKWKKSNSRACKFSGNFRMYG
jgi:hypothetical protein